MLADPFDIIGTVVDGRYRIERVAGQGGFGVVYRAFHLGFEAPIALKVLKLPPRWSSAKREARVVAFQREGRVLFELSRLHPAIVRAYETGTLWTRGTPTPYLSLEWLDGVSLDHELRYRRDRQLHGFALDEVLALLADPAAGLARAHAQGVAHRDIKPGNLFVSCNGLERSCKILDFGIAKMVVDDAGPDAIDGSETAGATSFTPKYAAPEQWSNRFGRTGPWTDVHALALVCCELISGRSPFPTAESDQLRAACLDERLRPTPRSSGVSLPAPVEAVFTRALALDPRERYQDVGAFWQALRDASQWSPSAATYNILSANDEQNGEHGTPATLNPTSSVSFAKSQHVTSVTCSRETSLSLAVRSPTTSLAPWVLLSAIFLATAAFNLRRLLPDVVGMNAVQPSSAPVTSLQPANEAITSSVLFDARESAVDAGVHEAWESTAFPPKVRAAPHRRRATDKTVPSQPTQAEPSSNGRGVASAGPQLLDVDLDDPGLIHRR